MTNNTCDYRLGQPPTANVTHSLDIDTSVNQGGNQRGTSHRAPRKRLWSVMLLFMLLIPSYSADLNVLIVGSTGNSTSTGHVLGSSPAFDPTAIRTCLQNILSGAGVGTVNVVVENRGSPYDLAAWCHYPYSAGVETATRWHNLRGESGTDWNCVGCDGLRGHASDEGQGAAGKVDLCIITRNYLSGFEAGQVSLPGVNRRDL